MHLIKSANIKTKQGRKDLTNLNKIILRDKISLLKKYFSFNVSINREFYSRHIKLELQKTFIVKIEIFGHTKRMYVDAFENKIVVKYKTNVKITYIYSRLTLLLCLEEV